MLQAALDISCRQHSTKKFSFVIYLQYYTSSEKEEQYSLDEIISDVLGETKHEYAMSVNRIEPK